MNPEIKLIHNCYLCKSPIEKGHSIGNCQFYLTTYFNKKPQWVCCCENCLISPQRIVELVNNFVNGRLEINDIPMAIRNILTVDKSIHRPNLNRNLIINFTFDKEIDLISFFGVEDKDLLIKDNSYDITTMNVICAKHMNFSEIQNIEEYKIENKIVVILEINNIDNKTKILSEINDKKITLLNPGMFKVVIKSII